MDCRQFTSRIETSFPWCRSKRGNPAGARSQPSGTTLKIAKLTMAAVMATFMLQPAFRPT